MSPALALDLALMGAVLLVALGAVNARSLFDAVVVYIIFGLLLALVWVRLEAPDLALAEAAIGAGITGALLLDAAGQLGPASTRSGDFRGFRRIAGAVAAIGFAVMLLAAVQSVAERRPSLGPMVLERLGESGVTHPVTAVLLNFRAYDTLLEVAVLLLGALAVLSLRNAEWLEDAGTEVPPEPISRATTAHLVPFAVLAGGYLLWRGTHAPGGAFQAGAVLGAAGVLLWLVGLPPLRLFAGRTLLGLLTVGMVVFLVVGAGGAGLGGAFLEYPAGAAGMLIVLVEAAVTASIAATLVLLFAGARPRRESPGGS
jgi:multisubunit Na+/H+ antiporter MnhB subunit